MSDLTDDFIEEDKRPGSPVDVYRLYLYFKRIRYWFILSLLLSGVLGMAIARALIPYSYEAVCTLIVSPGAPEDLRPMEIQAEADSVKLSSNLDTVRQRLGVRIPNKIFAELIKVEFDIQRSNLLTIQSSWDSAEGAAKAANTVAEVFLAYEKKKDQTQAQEEVSRLQADLDAASARLANHRQVYTALRKEKGVSDITVETRLAVEEAAKLRFEADKGIEEAKRIRAVVNASDARQRESSAPVAPSASDSREAAGARYELVQARARLAAVSSRLPPEHPTVKAIEQEVKALERATPQQVKRYRISTARDELDRVLVSQSRLDAAASRAEQRVRQLAENESEMTAILTDIRVVEQHVEALKSKLANARDAARDSSSIFRMLTKAQVPPYPVKSKRKLVALVLATILALLVVATFLFYALSGLRVYTGAEAAFWADAPVVGSSTWPLDAEALSTLIRDLDDFAPSATGSTLVVSLADPESELAIQVARQLSTQGRLSIRPSNRPASSDPPAHNSSSPPPPGDSPLQCEIRPWVEQPTGSGLRRAARLADRVLVLVRSGSSTATELARLSTILGRSEGIGIVLLALNPVFQLLPDRVGEVEQFWNARRKTSG